MRTLSDAGLALIKEFEGCKLKAYKCPADVWTIGWGATGPEIKEGLVWTQDQADKRFAEDVRVYCLSVENFTKGTPLNDNQFAALVSFAYNVGAWRSSTLFKHILKKEYSGAAENFPLWCHSGGRVLPGLVNRRQAERELFETPVKPA